MSISSWYFCSQYDIQVVYDSDGIHTDPRKER